MQECESSLTSPLCCWLYEDCVFKSWHDHHYSNARFITFPLFITPPLSCQRSLSKPLFSSFHIYSRRLQPAPQNSHLSGVIVRQSQRRVSLPNTPYNVIHIKEIVLFISIWCMYLICFNNCS